ncbi:hypothetical protein EJ08DRAFT_594529 [Tothia fuscella]|uniref:F-box domain-containing protein n=1 Tax=Tothia fuscella TaxID=1048955 RepID=A0A9P4NKJ0_9PEZI|nr:hypothetical protein EJ08DRAFT_594529 [Tothia fuscella]
MAHATTRRRRREQLSPVVHFPPNEPVNRLVPGRHIITTSPVKQYSNSSHGRQLPLSLILMITSYLDSPADISRVTRSSKLLYYLNLPKLYESVTLYSYREIRYPDGRAEGFGGGSPFTMALDGLVSGKAASFVRSFRLVGMWKEIDLEDFQRGRVPDNTMILNIVIKAALERMEKLKTFCWELNTKPLKTIYQGLASKPMLTSLTLKFPRTRIVRPTVVVPPMPSLTSIYLVDIDPLCFPDDFSTLFLHARKLEDLRIEWNPRMRREKEPSICLSAYFGECLSAGVKLPIKRLALKNMFAKNNKELDRVIDPTTMESVTMINCVDPEDASTIFYDNTWILQHRQKAPGPSPKLTKLRVDRLDKSQELPLAGWGHFEEIYLVNTPPSATPSPQSSLSPAQPSSSPEKSVASPATSQSSDGKETSPSQGSLMLTRPESPHSQVEFASSFLAAITSRHGATLKKLLLSDKWCLSGPTIKHVFTSCPQITQIGLALDSNDFELLRPLIRLAPRMHAIRVLIRPDMPVYHTVADIAPEMYCFAIGLETWRPEYRNLRWVGIGSQYFELGGIYREGTTFKRRVHKRTWDEIKHVEIFGMDTFDI